MGLEPMTLRLKVWCSTDWANRAHGNENTQRWHQSMRLGIDFIFDLEVHCAQWTHQLSIGSSYIAVARWVKLKIQSNATPLFPLKSLARILLLMSGISNSLQDCSPPLAVLVTKRSLSARLTMWPHSSSDRKLGISGNEEMKTCQ